jgi:hypothetical protein
VFPSLFGVPYHQKSFITFVTVNFVYFLGLVSKGEQPDVELQLHAEGDEQADVPQGEQESGVPRPKSM